MLSKGSPQYKKKNTLRLVLEDGWKYTKNSYKYTLVLDFN